MKSVQMREQDWVMRMLDCDIDETYGLQQLIIQEIRLVKVTVFDLPRFVYARANDKGIVERELRPWSF